MPQGSLPAFNASLLAGFLLVSCASEASPPPPDPLGFRIQTHTRALAADELGGRAAGSTGGEAAARYIETQLRRAGLEPAGTKGYRQDVSLTGVRTLPRTRLVYGRGDSGVAPLADSWEVPPDLYIAGWNRPVKGARRAGELVFVGYGVVSDHAGRDDLAGADLSGKWAVALADEPPDLSGTVPLPSLQPLAKLHAAARRGALGLVLLVHEREWPEPYELGREERVLPGWGKGARGQSIPWIGMRGELAERLGGGRNLWEEALAPDFKARTLQGTLRLDLHQDVRSFTSANVLARLPGTDPELTSRHVCLSAHYDGLGRTPTRIYRGVIDNAVSVAELLEAAALAREEGGSRRSLLFFFPTAEEAGLLGSRYFVEHPTVPLEHVTACLNKDGAPEAWGRSTDVIAIGADAAPPFASALQDAVARLGLIWSPNPFPTQGFFFRSDHYSFLRAGVPAALLFLGLGFEDRPPTWGLEQAGLYLAAHYHRPTDDLSQVRDWQGTAQYARLWLALARALADGAELPRREITIADQD